MSFEKMSLIRDQTMGTNEWKDDPAKFLLHY